MTYLVEIIKVKLSEDEYKLIDNETICYTSVKCGFVVTCYKLDLETAKTWFNKYWNNGDGCLYSIIHISKAGKESYLIKKRKIKCVDDLQ